MQDYVRRRLSGAETVPAPAQNPAADYVMAQLVPQAPPSALPLGGGASVPPSTMTDSPQLLEAPDTGDETSAHPLSNQQQSLEDTRSRINELQQQLDPANKAIDAAKTLDDRKAAFARWQAIVEEMNGLHEQVMSSPSYERIRRLGVASDAASEDANVMQRAIQDRQNQPRVPLPPPAPGGVSPNAPAVPLSPSTRDLTS